MNCSSIFHVAEDMDVLAGGFLLLSDSSPEDLFLLVIKLLSHIA